MKKVLVCVLCLALVLGVCVGCTNEASQTEQSPSTSQSSASSGGDKAKDDIKVLVLAKKLADPFSTWLMNMVEYNFKQSYPNVQYTILDQAGDPATTESFLEQGLLDGYDVVLLQKVSGSQDTDELLKRFADQGLRTVVVNNDVNDGVSSAVFFPEYTMGTMIATYAAKNLPKDAKVCLIKSTPSLFSSEQRAKGYEDVLAKERPDVEILDTQNVQDWNKDLAINVMSDWCQRFDTIDGIISCNDGMVLGAIEAAKSDNRDVQKMQFYGIDGLADGCLSIEAGEMTASVLQNAEEMAKYGVELAVKTAQNPDMPAEKKELEPTLITKDNIDEMLEMHRKTGIIK